MLTTQLDEYLSQTSLSVTAGQKRQLIEFINMLHKWNKAYNLTAVKAPQQMLIRHIMDSLVIGEHLQGQTFIDVGSGPGLPGIPLAILFPKKEFFLLDSLGKRIRFQKQVQYQLELKNVSSIESRVEDFHPDVLFDGVLSRAFASIADMLNWCQHLPTEDGIFYALKGQLSTEEMEALPDEFDIIDTIKLQVPHLNESRHLVKIQKKMAHDLKANSN